jgi:hypothetical protein
MYSEFLVALEKGQKAREDCAYGLEAHGTLFHAVACHNGTTF